MAGRRGLPRLALLAVLVSLAAYFVWPSLRGDDDLDETDYDQADYDYDEDYGEDGDFVDVRLLWTC